MRETAPLWALCSVNDEALSDKTDPGFSFEYVDISNVSEGHINNDLETLTFATAPSRARRIARPGDVIVSTVRTYLRAIACVGEAENQRVYSTGFAVLRANSQDIDPRYIGYLLGSNQVLDEIVATSVGVSYPAIQASALHRIRVPFAQFDQQQRIADYLDRETAEIDAMIRKLNELAETLKIRRTAVIASIAGTNRAKETRPLQWLATLTTGSTPSGGSGEENFAAEGAVGWVTPEDLQTTLALTRFPTVAALDQLTVVPPHSTLVCGIGASVGKLGFAEFPVTTNQQVTAAVPRDGVHGRYLYYALAAEKEQLLANTVTTTLPIINNARLGSLTIKLCSPAEQERIANYLDDVTSKIDAMLAKTAELKDLLLERRSALITDVVTGRKDPA